MKRAPRSKADRLATQEQGHRLLCPLRRNRTGPRSPPRSSLISNDFLPAGTELARWARSFDPALTQPDITQACRNAWTACGLQLLLGERAVLTPSILGYSLLYPYTDNHLDRTRHLGRSQAPVQHAASATACAATALVPGISREPAPWALVELIEGQYPRALYPQVFDCLLAIHRAQEESLAQLHSDAAASDAEILRITLRQRRHLRARRCLFCTRLARPDRKAGSPLTGACCCNSATICRTSATISDRGSVTLFTRAIALGLPLDGLVTQLLNFSEEAGAAMDALPSGTETLKNLMRMSWRSLIIGAVAHASDFFSPAFLREAESRSPFRFDFIRARQKRLTARRGLYEVLFDAFLEACPETESGRRESTPEPATIRLSF